MLKDDQKVARGVKYPLNKELLEDKLKILNDTISIQKEDHNIDNLGDKTIKAFKNSSKESKIKDKKKANNGWFNEDLINLKRKIKYNWEDLHKIVKNIQKGQIISLCNERNNSLFKDEYYNKFHFLKTFINFN